MSDPGEEIRRSRFAPVVKGTLAVTAAVVAVILIVVALRSVAGFFWIDGREGLGNAGYLMVGLFYLILAGPFVAIAFALGMPLISDDQKWRG